MFGLSQGGESRAWPLKSFGWRPSCARRTWPARRSSSSGTAAHGPRRPIAPETEGPKSEPVTLAVDLSDPESPWVDKETGSRWSVVGRAVSGPRKGQTLRWLPGVMVKWYAWAASYPKTRLDGPEETSRAGSTHENRPRP